MFDFLKPQKKYRILTPIKKRDKNILEEPRFMPEEEKKPEKEDDSEVLVNYLRKPKSARSKNCLLYAIISGVLMTVAVRLTLRAHGDASLTVSAIAASSLIFSVFSVGYGIAAFMEKNKNYLFAFIGIGLGGIEFVTWFVTMIIGAAA